jgi:hypothetical protein
MSRKTFGKVMPRPLTRNLELMGEQIMLARKHLLLRNLISPYSLSPPLNIPTVCRF